MSIPGTPLLDLSDRHIGKRIKERRVELGWHQEDLAQALGISWEQVVKYESGENPVTAVRLYELSKALNVPITWFYRDAAGVALAGDDPLVEEIVHGVRGISNRALKMQALSMLRLVIEIDQERTCETDNTDPKLVALRRS